MGGMKSYLERTGWGEQESKEIQLFLAATVRTSFQDVKEETSQLAFLKERLNRSDYRCH
jgi:hypothetical protein